MENIVRCKERPAALYCFGDGVAAGALSRGQQLGLRVPEDISITGYDDRAREARARHSHAPSAAPRVAMTRRYQWKESLGVRRPPSA